MIGTLARREPGAPLFAVGASPGGNVLLKWLGEHPGQTTVAAAVASRRPTILAAGSRHLETPIGGFYVRGFLRTLQAEGASWSPRVFQAAARIDLERVARSRTFRDFDDAATGPCTDSRARRTTTLRSSSLGFLSRIQTPTLCLSAEDDPFLPASVLPRVRGGVILRRDSRDDAPGGHVGFVSSSGSPLLGRGDGGQLVCAVSPRGSEGAMIIARLWHSVTTAENASQYEDLLRARSCRESHRVEGYRGAYLLRREVPEGAEFVTLTLFESMDAVRRFAGDDPEKAVVPEQAAPALARFDSRSVHYTVCSSPRNLSRSGLQLLPGPAAPAARPGRLAVFRRRGAFSAAAGRRPGRMRASGSSLSARARKEARIGDGSFRR